MKKILRFIFYVCLMLIFITTVSTTIITSFYGEQIEQSVSENINTKITSKIDFSKIEFTPFKYFPFASVKFNQLILYEKNNQDTLLYAEEAFVNLSLYDIILKDFHIKRISLNNGIININYDEHNNPNYLIVDSKKENKKSIVIEECILVNTKINYENIIQKTTINWDVQKSILSFNNNNLTLNGNLFSKNFTVNNVNYINNKTCNLESTLNIDSNMVIINNSDILIENVLVSLEGSIRKNNFLDINFYTKKQSLNGIIRNTPKKFKHIYSSFIADGFLNCNGQIKGVLNKENNPYFNIDFTIEKGSFELKNNAFILNNINTNGSINNGELMSFKTTNIDFYNFSSNTKKGILSGDFTIRDLTNYHLKAKLKSTWDLSELNTFFKNSPFIKLEGELSAFSNYNGYFSFDKTFSALFLNANHYSDTELKNVSFSYNNHPIIFSIKSADIKFENNTISVSNMTSTIGESDLNYTGEILDFIPYILNKKEIFSLTGKLHSIYTNLSEINTLNQLSVQTTNNKFPDWISINLNTNFETISYKKLILNNTNTDIIYKQKKIDLMKTSTYVLNGSITGNLMMREDRANNLKLSSDIKFAKINIRDLFRTFNNFNQEFMKEQNVKGSGSGEINIDAYWKPLFVFDSENLKITSSLTIEKGELINFKPLENLSYFVNLDDLKHVQFSKLENTIDVSNKIITIPSMQINSNALSVFVSGKHTFNQEIDYNIKLLLSELLSNKFKKQNSTPRFGELNENGETLTAVYLKMQGNTENPKITFDGEKIKSEIEKSITSEIETIKTIIKEDVLNINNKAKDKEEEEEEEDEQKILIDWEEEDYKPK